jgi:hypothetical protein
MASFETYAKYIQEGLDELEDYLLSDELFWSLNIWGDSPFPRMTVGNMLLFMTYLRSSITIPAQEAQYARLETELFAITKRWQAAWERKAAREFTSRLRQWATYLEELRKEPNTHIDYFKTEVRLRVLLELLGETLPDPPESPAVLDEHLRPIFDDGEFLWDQAVQGGFPPEDYWFLYGKLVPQEEITG